MSAPVRAAEDDTPESQPAAPTPQRPRYPFLQHDSQQKSSSPSSPRVRRSSSASIGSIPRSIGGTLDSTSNGASALDNLSQNAISSLLSHPIVRTGLVPQSALTVPSAHRAPSARDIPPVTLTPIPQVEASAFKPYLARVGVLFDSYQRSKQGNDDTAATPFQRAETQEPKSDYFEGRGQSSPLPLSPTTSRTPTDLSSPTSPNDRRKLPSISGTPRRDKFAPTPLSTIPSVYFEDNFQLENPRTFDVVSERSDVIPPEPRSSREESKSANGTAKAPGATTRRKALHTNAILQEKLSWYMDTVEVHLISSIATASASFFAALGSLKELQSEATDSITKIQSLRQALQNLDNEMAKGGLEVLNMRRRRENLRRLGNAVSQLCEVTEEAVRCETLVDDGKLEEADSQIDLLEDLIAGKTSSAPDRNFPPRIDLRQLKALDGIADGISQVRQRIGKGYESRFIDALLSDLRKHIESVPPQDTLQRWAKASFRSRGDHSRAKSTFPAYLSTNEELRPDLLKALAGLNRAGHTARAATAYKEAILREIKSLIRRHLPSSSDDDAESVTSISTSLSTRGHRRLNQQEKSSILARNLRALDPDAAEELLIKVYTSVGEALRRMGVQVKVVLDVTSSLEQPTEIPSRSSSLTPSSENSQIREEVTQALDMSNLLGQAVDVIQTQVTKVLKVRNNENARLPLQQFLRYFTLNRLFTDECEAVSSRGGEALKDVVNAQVKDFLQIFADAERQRIMQTLEADRWDAKDFGPSDSLVLERVLESMNQTPKSWTEHTQLLEESPLPTSSNGASHLNADTPVSQAADNAPPTKTRSATIDGQPYFLVHSTLSALYAIDQFLNLAAAIPSLTADSALKLLEYLKAFNSRCCQLILGAGATKSAGLKNITSKHLALASQACSFLIALVPYMREFVRRQAGGNVGNVFAEFDKVKRLLQDHQSSIHEKLVDIMSQRCTAHINTMKKVDWDAKELQPGVSPYMESLTKETGTLHRVLSRHVMEMVVRMIMTPIFSHYNQEWTKAFREAVVKTEAGKTRMLRDVEYLESKFAKIDGSAELGPNLVALVKAKPIQDQDGPPQPPPSTAVGTKSEAPGANAKEVTTTDTTPAQSAATESTAPEVAVAQPTIAEPTPAETTHDPPPALDADVPADTTADQVNGVETVPTEATEEHTETEAHETTSALNEDGSQPTEGPVLAEADATDVSAVIPATEDGGDDAQSKETS